MKLIAAALIAVAILSAPLHAATCNGVPGVVKTVRKSGAAVSL